MGKKFDERPQITYDEARRNMERYKASASEERLANIVLRSIQDFLADEFSECSYTTWCDIRRNIIDLAFGKIAKAHCLNGKTFSIETQIVSNEKEVITVEIRVKGKNKKVQIPLKLTHGYLLDRQPETYVKMKVEPSYWTDEDNSESYKRLSDDMRKKQYYNRRKQEKQKYEPPVNPLFDFD